MEGSENIPARPQGVKSKVKGMESVFVGPCEAEVSESSTAMPEGGALLRQLDPPGTANSEGSELGG